TGEDTFETAQSAADNFISGWNLGNTLDSTGKWISGGTAAYETAWGNVVTTQEIINTVKDAGFNAIRLPVTWEFHIDKNGNVNKAWMKRVHQVVDYVINQDMYCILNVHHDRWVSAYQESYEKNSAKFATLWTDIANEFKDYGEKLLFESTNEMLDKEQNWGGTSENNYKVLNNWNQLFVNSVRLTGGKNYCRNLVTMTYAGSSDSKIMDAFVLPKDVVENHLMLEVHNYDPQAFCWSDATWTKMTAVWDEERFSSDLISTFNRMQSYATKLNVPIIIGEWGSVKKLLPNSTEYNDEERAKHAEFFISETVKRNIKCFWWDCGDFALIDRKVPEQIHKPVINAIITAANKK
ncbi:MAG: glycoside hydrolase family 5 protein, partial [Treponema sp.]